MAGNPKQKIKLLYIIDILKKYSDEDHPISATKICEKLALEDIKAERKGIYEDIKVLQEYGYDIILTRAPSGGFFLGERDFEVPEVHLLMDAVESANFITPKKTRELIAKLGQVLSKFQLDAINNQIFFDGRSKCENEEIYYNIDIIGRAISLTKKVKFIYEKRILGEGKITKQIKTHTVSPYALVWVSDHYYLVGNNEKYDNLTHLRVDRIKSVEILKDDSRYFGEVSDYDGFFDTADYVAKTFNMFGGEEKRIELCCTDRILEPVVDKFGDKIMIIPKNDGTFKFTASANISEGLIGWILQFGDEAEVVSPKELRELVKQKIAKMAEKY